MNRVRSEASLNVFLIRVFHNPPKGDRREVVLFCEIGDLEGFGRPYEGKNEE